jgi:histidine triad (HIT) family protein
MIQNHDCLFCKIAGGVIPAKIVLEDEYAVAFLDIAPRVAGHTVVIPRYHAPVLVELPDGEVGPLFLMVKRSAELIMRTLHPDGITIGVNQGRVSGQEVDHLHIHLMPRWRGDGGSSVQSVVHTPLRESMDEIYRRMTIQQKTGQ